MELITLRDRVLQTLKEVELDILKEIDRICRKHGIKYSLGGGTCLGQYRHGGIIPWDDDIDIDMVGDNYDRFIEVALKELDPDSFFLRCRQTSPFHLRTACRVEMKNTQLSIPAWDKAGLECGVFVDIFRWSYLPDEEEERRRVASRLYFLRCAESNLMFGSIAKKLDPKLIKPLKEFVANTPVSEILAEEDRLTHCCGAQKTHWIIDDAIINGDHGGYPSDGIDEYVDQSFEGITVMNKKNPYHFLSTIYGPDFDKWLPPVSRISHHRWTKLDLGEYARKNGLPEDYAYCMTCHYNPTKLLRMQELTVEMYAKVDEICTKHGLPYFILGNDAFTAASRLDEAAPYWKGPGIIAMPRKTYEQFGELCRTELGAKYLYQSLETDSSYGDIVARIRCNGTHVMEAHMPVGMQTPETDGFFIRIVPLEYTSRFGFVRQMHRLTLRVLQSAVKEKWICNDERAKHRIRAKSGRKYALKAHAVDMVSKDQLIRIRNWVRGWFAKTPTGWYVTANCKFLDFAVISDTVLGKGARLDFCGKSLRFPENQQGYCKVTAGLQNKNKILTQLCKLAELNTGSEEYQQYLSSMLETACGEALGVLPQCNLDYLDVPEYQLSVCRYDEKNDRYLTNMELLGFE